MKTLWMTLIGVSLALAACSAGAGGQVPDATVAVPPLDTPTAVPPQATHIPVDQTPAQRAAIAALAKGLGIPGSQISLDSTEAVVWPNGCMGVQRLGVMCTMNQVPGFRILLSANQLQYEVHTNQDGTIVAPEQPMPSSVASRKVAVHQLASNLGIADSAVKVVSVAMVEWPDSCLGVTQQGVMCAQMVTPGYLLTLEANGRQYEYHTNGDASEIMPGILAMNWSQNGGIAGLCQELTVYLSGEIYAQNCRAGGDQHTGILTAVQRAQLESWYGKLANTTIDMSDPKGAADAMSRTAELLGAGSQPASDADKNAIFEFGQSLYHSLYP